MQTSPVLHRYILIYNSTEYRFKFFTEQDRINKVFYYAIITLVQNFLRTQLASNLNLR
jgi:hypothetical protein